MIVGGTAVEQEIAIWKSEGFRCKEGPPLLMFISSIRDMVIVSWFTVDCGSLQRVVSVFCAPKA